MSFQALTDTCYITDAVTATAVFGLHNFRHSLSSGLVNKCKTEPKTVRSLLCDSRIRTTLDIYTQGDGDETRAAQGAFLKELGLASELVQ